MRMVQLVSMAKRSKALEDRLRLTEAREKRAREELQAAGISGESSRCKTPYSPRSDAKYMKGVPCGSTPEAAASSLGEGALRSASLQI